MTRPPAPLYAPGDRVRCLVSTAEDMGGLELHGRAGTVERCLPVGDPWDRGWDVTVVWDGVLPPMLAHHDPEELEPASPCPRR